MSPGGMLEGLHLRGSNHALRDREILFGPKRTWLKVKLQVSDWEHGFRLYSFPLKSTFVLVCKNNTRSGCGLVKICRAFFHTRGSRVRIAVTRCIGKSNCANLNWTYSFRRMNTFSKAYHSGKESNTGKRPRKKKIHIYKNTICTDLIHLCKTERKYNNSLLNTNMLKLSMLNIRYTRDKFQRKPGKVSKFLWWDLRKVLH